MAVPNLPGLLQNLVYPAALTAFGLIGNACILGGQIHEVKDDIICQIHEMKGDVKEIKDDIRGLIHEMNGDMKEMKDDIRGQIYEMKGDMKEMKDDIIDLIRR